MTHTFDAAARWLSRPWVCALFIGVLVPAFAYGFYVRWSTGYVLALTLFLSVMSYIVPFVFLYSQARGDAATQAKLDELVRVTEAARDELIGAEELPAEEIVALREV
jgi:low affinity Fe/Cu permease